jgi:hypothetical protein
VTLTTVRNVPLDADQIAAIEEIGEELLRQGDPRASSLLTIGLQWRLLCRYEPNNYSKRIETVDRTLRVLEGGA